MKNSDAKSAVLGRYAVMGNPVAHSLSPIIHQDFASQTQQQIIYEKLLVPLDGFPQTVHDFYNQGGLGANVTLPFKEQAWNLADELAPLASKAGAVNTLLFLAGGKIRGYNTDGIGLIRDIVNNSGLSITHKRVLLLGAGGAARGALVALLAETPEFLMIANRTKAKAEILAQEFSGEGEIASCGFEELIDQQFDMIINATSASLREEKLPLPDNIIAAEGCCYDMAYGKPLPFLLWAQKQGVKHCLDGLGMLVEQAAESFYLWRGVRPQTKPVIEKLRQLIASRGSS